MPGAAYHCHTTNRRENDMTMTTTPPAETPTPAERVRGLLEDCQAEIAETIDYLTGLQREALAYQISLAYSAS